MVCTGAGYATWAFVAGPDIHGCGVGKADFLLAVGRFRNAAGVWIDRGAIANRRRVGWFKLRFKAAYGD